VLEDEADGAIGKNDPCEECEAETPDESGAGAGGAAREESAECYTEDCAVDQGLRNGRVNRGDSQRAASGSDEEADGCEHEEMGLPGRDFW
jgi:hypothetical protein